MSDKLDDIIVLDEEDSVPKSPSIYILESSPESYSVTPPTRPSSNDRNSFIALYSHDYHTIVWYYHTGAFPNLPIETR